MTRAKISSVVGALAVGAGTVLMLIGIVPLQTGCETQSAEGSSLRVEPHSIGLRLNESAAFTATGGFTYKWSLSDPSLGVLTRSEGPTTTYISRFNPEAGATVVIQTLTVTSQVGPTVDVTRDTTNDGTNTADISRSGFIDTAEAIIEHLPTGEDPTSTTTPTTSTSSTTTTTILGTLNVSPTDASLSSGQSRAFTASGEGPNYSWSLSNANFGSLNTTSGSAVTYTANSTSIMTPTEVTLTVTSNGKSDSASIVRIQ